MPVEALRRNRRPFWKIARESGLSRVPVARIGKAKGLSRLSNLDPKIEIVRDEKTLPGEMIHIDIEKLEEARPHRRGRTSHHRQSHRESAPRRRKQGGKGGEYLDSAVDDHSGWPPLKSCQMKHAAPA